MSHILGSRKTRPRSVLSARTCRATGPTVSWRQTAWTAWQCLAPSARQKPCCPGSERHCDDHEDRDVPLADLHHLLVIRETPASSTSREAREDPGIGRGGRERPEWAKGSFSSGSVLRILVFRRRRRWRGERV